MKSLTRTAVAALLMAAVAMIHSIAQAAFASTALNERTGPGTRFPVVATIPARSFVGVRSCRGSWCRVTWRGVPGWASGRYLGRRGPRYRFAPVVVAPRPVVGFGVEFGTGFHRHHRFLGYRNRPVFVGAVRGPYRMHPGGPMFRTRHGCVGGFCR